MDKLTIKSKPEIEIMSNNGHLLANIRNQLTMMIKPGVSDLEVEDLACRLISKTGGQASFKLVPGYKHSTCLNINDVVVHGIPNGYIFKEGDVVGIDVGLYLNGFHSDTSTTTVAGSQTKEQRFFLKTGKNALKKAINAAKPGKRVFDVSKTMQDVVEKAGFSTVKALTGHGIGINLHEEPAIPCFVYGEREKSPIIRVGMVFAIEVMYNQGVDDVEYKNDDGWTIVTADGKISGLFEHTVAILESGPVVLTE